MFSLDFKGLIQPTRLSVMLAVVFICGYAPLLAQRNISGKSGLLNVPDADSIQAGTFALGYFYNPKEYSLRKNGLWSEQILYADLAVFDRLSITFFLLQGRRDGKRIKTEGLGDRQLDVRWQILKETPKQPGLVFVMSSPFTVDAALQTLALSASKTVWQNSDFQLRATAGYGSPYYIYRKVDGQNSMYLNLHNDNIFSNLSFQKKSEDTFKNNYLVGPFGGLKLSFKEKIDFMAEWDGQRVNAGVHTQIFKILHAQAGFLNFDQLTWSLYLEQNLNQPLFKRKNKL